MAADKTHVLQRTLSTDGSPSSYIIVVNPHKFRKSREGSSQAVGDNCDSEEKNTAAHQSVSLRSISSEDPAMEVSASANVLRKGPAVQVQPTVCVDLEEQPGESVNISSKDIAVQSSTVASNNSRENSDMVSSASVTISRVNPLVPPAVITISRERQEVKPNISVSVDSREGQSAQPSGSVSVSDTSRDETGPDELLNDSANDAEEEVLNVAAGLNTAPSGRRKRRSSAALDGIWSDIIRMHRETMDMENRKVAALERLVNIFERQYGST